MEAEDRLINTTLMACAFAFRVLPRAHNSALIICLPIFAAGDDDESEDADEQRQYPKRRGVDARTDGESSVSSDALGAYRGSMPSASSQRMDSKHTRKMLSQSPTNDDGFFVLRFRPFMCMLHVPRLMACLQFCVLVCVSRWRYSCDVIIHVTASAHGRSCPAAGIR